MEFYPEEREGTWSVRGTCRSSAWGAGHPLPIRMAARAQGSSPGETGATGLHAIFRGSAAVA